MDLKDFIALSLTQIVEGVAKSAKAISDAGGSVSPAFTPSNTAERLGLSKDGMQRIVYGVDFDVAVVASSSESLEGGAKLTVAGLFSVGGKASGVEREEVTSRIRFMVPLQLPTDPVSDLAATEAARLRQIEDDRIGRQIDEANRGL